MICYCVREEPVRGEPVPATQTNADSMPMGVVMRRSPGVTRWAKWVWKAVDVLPGAGVAEWKLLRSQGEVSDFHAATELLSLYPSDTEAYAHELGAQTPCVYVILRPSETACSDAELEVHYVTVSPYEAQDYADTGEEIVEKVPMPAAVLAWVEDFVATHHVEEEFVKRKRDKKRVDLKDDGIGDARISQATDVYRAPSRKVREAAE